MLAIGLAAGAIAAHLGLGLTGQLVAAAIVGGGAVALWRARRQASPVALPAQANRDVNLDIGERVRIDEWQADGTARVTYRGAQWTARYGDADTPTPGEHVIRAVDGNRLMVGR